MWDQGEGVCEIPKTLRVVSGLKGALPKELGRVTWRHRFLVG